MNDSQPELSFPDTNIQIHKPIEDPGNGTIDDTNLNFRKATKNRVGKQVSWTNMNKEISRKEPVEEDTNK